MTIFLDLAGASGTAFFNLLTISGDDGGLGLTDVPGNPSVFQITYELTPGQPATADRLNQLVNNDFGAPIVTTQDIVVTAVNGGNDPYLGADVTGNGFTYLDGDVIRVVYDVSRCCGAGVYNLDVDGNHITKPNPVVLYHELSHAFRAVTDTNEPNDDIPAETDENVLRTQLGLCLRDVNNHEGDCGSGDDCGGSDGGPDGGPPEGGCAAGPSGGGGCFIVSATTGSPFSVEVNRLRHLRGRLRIVSRLAAQLIEVIYEEYRQFSPAMAAQLQQDALARETVLQIVVRPLLAWYTLAGLLALQPADEARVKQAVQEVLDACPPYLSGSIVGLLDAIRSGEPLPPAASPLLQGFAPQVQAAARFPHASWAILDPLLWAWQLPAGEHEVVEAVSQWLTSVPLDVLLLPEEPKRLERELAVLASFFNFKAMARQQFGERLATEWPEAVSAFKRHGFV